MTYSAFKGVLTLSVFSLAFLGAAAILPDSAWEQIPDKLIPVRTLLAERGIISSHFMTVPAPSVRGKRISAAPKRKLSLSQQPEEVDPEVQECPGGACPVPSLQASSPVVSDLTDSPLQEPPSAYEAALGQEPPASTALQEPSEILSSGLIPTSELPSFLPTDSGMVTQASDSSPQPTGEFLPLLQSGPVSSLSNQGNDTLPDLRFDDYPALPTSAEIPAPASDLDEPFTIQSKEAPSAGTPSLSQKIEDALAVSTEDGKILEAFYTLNELYKMPTLTPDDRMRISMALDRLAFEIFYNPKNFLMEPAYQVRPNETLSSIASRYSIEPELLAVLNQLVVGPNDPLQAGTQLKVVKGPIDAEISLQRMELLLRFNGLYAGRFKMGAAQNALALRGQFPVSRKVLNPEYHGPLSNGQMGVIAGGDNANPLGKCWIELNGGLGLQGTNQPDLIGKTTAPVGGFIFSNQDITNLNILLPMGAMVQVVD